MATSGPGPACVSTLHMFAARAPSAQQDQGGRGQCGSACPTKQRATLFDVSNTSQVGVGDVADLEAYVSCRAFGVASIDGDLVAGAAVEDTLEIASITKVCRCTNMSLQSLRTFFAQAHTTNKLPFTLEGGMRAW